MSEIPKGVDYLEACYRCGEIYGAKTSIKHVCDPVQLKGEFIPTYSVLQSEVARLTSALEAAERGLEHARRAKSAIETAMIMSTTSQQWKRISKAHSELILAVDGCLAEIAEIKGSK